MPPVPLPEHASLEHLKKQAKLVQQLVRAGDAGAHDMVIEFHPRVDDTGRFDADAFRRSDAQLVVARMYGFPSWTSLRDHLQLVDDSAGAGPADHDLGGAGNRFVSLACVSYSHDDVVGRLAEAGQMLDDDPNLATTGVASLAVSGSHRRMAAELVADSSVANRRCEPHDWPPILYCAYSRVEGPDPEHSTLETARVLLRAGADPDAGFLWHGLLPPFTALTGALGRGEHDQPAHPDAFALARLLLEAGADPNDGQALYNNGLAGSAHDDPRHLELLIEFGLGTDHGGPWYRRFGPRLTTPDALLYDELEVAAHRGLPNRMRFLIGLDLDLERPVGRSRQPPMTLAQRAGHDEIVALLTDADVTTGRSDGGRP